ncbi:hypothetical protein K440DRAFT_658737 [Wilcoxina mikolae CBS 423.85]|nr:hypothetical protein K440DRAFT_658737 [Wilcoxina mikolae CBS 423.85]
MGSLTQAQSEAQAIEDLEHTEAAEKAQKTRRTGSWRSVQKGGVLYASEARSMATKKVVNELLQAQLIVDRAAKAEAKKNRKIFLDAVTTKRREILKKHVAHKKLRKELCTEIRAKALVRVLARPSLRGRTRGTPVGHE